MNPAAHVWGPWISIGFTALVWLAFNVIAVSLALVFIHYGWLNADTDPAVLQHNGLFLAISTLVNAVLCSGLIIGFIKLRRGSRLYISLSLREVPLRWIGIWLGVLVLFIVTTESIGYWLERPLVPDFMIKAYSSAVVPALLWLALIVAAPVFEELLFRGFLQTSLETAAMDAGWAILIPALFWSVMHWQYDFYDMSWIFLFGVLLGLARWHSGSLFMPVLMHMSVNLMATVATAKLVA